MKKQLLGTLAAASLTAGLTVPAQAEVTATAGMVSDYVFRGSEYGDAAAYFSVDYEKSGFYAGVWSIMDGGNAGSGSGQTGNINDPDSEGSVPVTTETSNSGLGLEIDYYFGYGMEFDNGFNFSLGYTAYTYSYNTQYLEDFEDEIGGSVGFNGFAASYFYGWAHSSEEGAATVPYMYYDLSWSGDVFGVVVGRYEQTKQPKESYNYAEVSASGEVATLDMTLSVGKKFTQEADGETAGSDAGTGYIVLDVSKTFSL